MKTDWDVIIIGAGAAGLSLGALLVQVPDRRGLILEASDEVGGKARVWRDQGFYFDNGVHALILGEASSGAAILSEIGRPIKVHGAGMCLYRDKRFLPLFSKNLASFFQQKALGWKDLRKFAHLAMDMPGIRKGKFYSVSVGEWLEQVQAGPGLRDFFRILSMGLLATDHLERASLGELILFGRLVARARHILGYPEGGWTGIFESLVEKVRSLPRARLEFGEKVQKILVEKGKVRGVIAGGREVTASQVVSSLPVQEIYQQGLLEPDQFPSLQARVENFRPTFGLVFDLGLDKLISKDDRIIASPDYPALFWFYSNLSPELAPPGKQILTVFTPLEKADLDSPTRLQDREKGIWEILDEMFPGIRKLAVIEKIRAIPINGLELNTAAGLPDRPRVDEYSNQGLYLIGDTVGVPGVGGELAFRSARECFRILSS